MTSTTNERPKGQRLNAALRLVLRRYFAQVLRWKGYAIPALLLPAVGDVLTIYAPPLVVARLLATFAQRQQAAFSEFIPYLATFAGLWIAGQLVWRVAVAMIIRAEIRALEALYVEAMDELLAKDTAFFQDNFAGSLTKRALGFARRFEDVFDVAAFQISAAFLPLVFAGVVLWSYSPWLIVVLGAMLAMTCAMIVPLVRRRRDLVDVREAASNLVAGHLADSIANAETVRAFAREREEAHMHATNVLDYGRKTQRSWDYQNTRVDLVTSPMFVLTNLAGLAIALVTARSGANLEAVFITFSYYTTATRVMWEFNRVYRNLEGALTDAAQFAELLLDPPAVTDANAPLVFAPASSGVEFRNIDFRYSTSQPRLFERFSLSVEPGTRLGIVGRSGGGKTTLTRLLLRFADVEEGEILVGGQRIDRVPQASLRQVIAYVPQDPAMFHRSIAENIRVGRPNATDGDVRDAARLAYADEFIESLPNGYATLVGERGVKLSGGQRQRIAIARAILKDAPILVLDEATSSLDSESERLIQDALWTLMSNRTAIVIAHRLSTVRRMDRLVILERGHIAEQGSHDALLAKGGIYAALWAHQSGGFLPSSDDEHADSPESRAHIA
jgi:ATP-binding cassette subfamily B protein